MNTELMYISGSGCLITSSQSFQKITELLENYIDQINPEDYRNIYLTGDINLTDLNKESHTFSRSVRIQNAQCCEMALEFMIECYLTTVDKKPTRGWGTLKGEDGSKIMNF